MSNFVIDSSFILSFLLPDESDSSVEDVFDSYLEGKTKFYAPLLLPFEVFNGLNIAVVRKRLDASVAKQLAQEFLRIDISLEFVDFSKTLKLSISNKLTFYDASYLYLARSQGFSLLTLDKKLVKLVAV